MPRPLPLAKSACRLRIARGLPLSPAPALAAALALALVVSRGLPNCKPQIPVVEGPSPSGCSSISRRSSSIVVVEFGRCPNIWSETGEINDLCPKSWVGPRVRL